MAEESRITEVIEPDDEVLEVASDEVQNTDEVAEEDDLGEVTVSIGDEESTTSEVDEEVKAAPQWVKDLREKTKEDARKIRELEQALKSKETVEQLPKLQDKPTLESCDFDTEVFEANLEKWHIDKRVHDDELAKKTAEANKANEEYQSKVKLYQENKTKLKVPDYADAEAEVLAKFDVTQQGIIVNYAKKPEVLVYALGKNPKALSELASIKDPIKYAFAVAELETKLKVTPRKAPPPEGKLTGSGSQGTADATLARLRAEAEKTGNYTKVVAYKKQMK
jgi:hypothetical protein